MVFSSAAQKKFGKVGLGKAPAILSTSISRGRTIPVPAIRYDQSRDYYCKCLLNRKEESFKTGEDLDVFQRQRRASLILDASSHVKQ